MRTPDLIAVHWVIYRPHAPVWHWSVRPHYIYRGIEPVRGRALLLPSLDDCRRVIPQGFAHLMRDPDDAPEIEEIWI
jgi:hypothetical protein